jgi:hypothetical protein
MSENNSNSNLKQNDYIDYYMKDYTNIYSLEYIGIPNAQLTKGQFPLLLNNSQYILIDNISYFIAKTKTNVSLSSYASENDEIGFNIYKGNSQEKVEVGENTDVDDFYDDIFDFDKNESEKSGKNEKEEGKNKILKNGGYEVEQNTNLIKQLKNKNIIKSYTFLIKYTNKNEEKGEIIIGGLPHEYDPKHFSEDYYIYDSVPVGSYPPYNWHTIFDKIEYDGNSSIARNYTYHRHVAFSLDFGFILAAINFKDYFDKNFFDNYTDLCHEEKIDKYIGIYCQKEVIKNFKNLSFYLSTKYNNKKNNKIEFDYNDLFIQSKHDPNIYYFQILFVQYSNRWVLGRPLFKKYPTIFDQDKKIFGFYLQTGNYNINETGKNDDINKNNNNENKMPWSLIIIIILVLCVIVLAVILCKVIPLIRRKKKANELDDDFDYESHDEKKESNQLYKE